MSFHLGYNESGKKIFIQHRDYFKKNGSILEIRNAVSEDGKYEFSFIDCIIVSFRVPKSGYYRIEAWGARGGGTSIAPKGAYSKSLVSLSESENLKILVGEKGYDGYDNSGTCKYCGGGGGGTFIVKEEEPICIAGGGGGYGYNDYSAVKPHACGQKSQYGGDPDSKQTTLKMGGLGSDHYGAGGGGLIGNGGDGIYQPGKGGYSFKNGGLRQTTSNYQGISCGGFGGGGSTHGCCGGSGGGGGYTGGSGSKQGPQAGGGGSYFIGSYKGEVSEAISGCETLPERPVSDNGNGFAVLTLLKDLSPVKKQTAHACHTAQISWPLYATIIQSGNI